MMILGIDPGPTHCGFVVYDSTAQRVIEAHKKIEIVEVTEVGQEGERATDTRPLQERIASGDVIVEVSPAVPAFPESDDSSVA